MDLHTGDNADSLGRVWLVRLWDREVVRAALSTASPALSEQITSALSDAPLERRQWRRLLVSVCSYVLRWRGRATPFGLFAGITTATLSPAVRIKFGEDHTIHHRIDPEWLDEVICRLEHDPTVLADVSLIVNNGGFTRADQFVVPKMLPSERIPGTETTEKLVEDLGMVELALRRTHPVAAALAAAQQPVRGWELVSQLEREFPGASREQITTMLTGLVANHVLITNLRAPATSTDPVGHLLTQLTRPDGQDSGPAPIAEIRESLRVLHRQMAAQDLHTVSPQVRKDGRPGSPLVEPRPAVDVVVDGQLALPDAVLREAEAAASTLLRVTRSPFGTAAWRDYHLRFRDRYGAGAAVPVRELVSDAGLGYPVGFLGAAREQPSRALTDRDAVLQRLVQEAVLDRRTEVVLSEALIGQLTVGDRTDLIPPERVELAFTLHARSANALTQGRFQLWVSGAPPASSSMIGRFASLLDEHDCRRLADTYTPDAEAMVAQLSFPPRRMHNDAVIRTPRLLPWLLPVAEHHAETSGCLALDDLAVTATATRFFLIHRPTGKRVHAHVLHALETTVFTPPLVRFLAELGTARSAVWGPFDFGSTRTLPFLPRVRSGRSVLAAARWLLDGADLPGPRASSRDWHEALVAWRCRWRVPAHVVLCEGEQRLPLDLDDPTQRSLVRTRLYGTKTVELREAGDPADLGWAGRACEFVVPLTATPRDKSRKFPRKERAAARGDLAAPDYTSIDVPRPAMPGKSDLLLAQLEGHPQRFDDVLTDYLPRLRERVGDGMVRFWFRRHHDTTRPDSDHYLQLFARLADAEQYGTVAAHIAAWVCELRDVGLIAQLSFETAWVQTGKYGADIASNEQVAAADSAAALTEIALARQSRLPVQAVAAVSLVDLATGLATTREEGWQWLITVIGQHHGLLDQSVREHALQLARHLGHPTRKPEPHHSLREAAVLTAWAQRREALAAYRVRLDRDPSRVLRALLHDHFNRTVAVHPEREAATQRLARTIALRAEALALQESS
ncbi:lantibiotic dehydratase [Amycolatopsis rhizosphaerae]|uniref:lantibiotic dehydratase n=1 Tax=Amycolatopsis rhizosphaerae TaxID=2053003 RepID=UPI0016437E06|nr:lantibiotic dehydratase [Amycolatopsis rhizosphaerae]